MYVFFVIGKISSRSRQDLSVEALNVICDLFSTQQLKRMFTTFNVNETVKSMTVVGTASKVAKGDDRPCRPSGFLQIRVTII